jgi:uncharacterized membrane protein (UPF0127 family)
MKFPIDAVFLDSKDSVIAIHQELVSNRLTPVYPKGASVLELPAGTVAATGTKVGDKIKVA